MASTELARLVQEAFADRARGDWDAMARRFDPDARWRAVDDGPFPCRNRDELIAMMRRHAPDAAGADAIASIEEVDGHAVVAFRPDPERDLGERPVDRGLAYVVVSVRDGLIVELKGCADRAAALAYARAGEAI